jgi:hypothetical protein
MDRESPSTGDLYAHHHRQEYSSSSSSTAQDIPGSISLPSRSPHGVKSEQEQPNTISPNKTVVPPPIKRRGKLPKPTTDLLKNWLHEHADHPYPSEDEKKSLCAMTGLTLNQVSNWMINVSLQFKSNLFWLVLPFISLFIFSRPIFASETKSELIFLFSLLG